KWDRCLADAVVKIEMGFHHVAQAGLELRVQTIHLPWPPNVPGLQA
ncbi:MINOS1-NBL1 isoform 4, partial [Pan troglodytes]